MINQNNESKQEP